ncbi:hypothetical protein [Terrarubrum flagellatum]|uniref:hypothetical protein n=1 Tax=Terrirubrum flagellatum TaxID=2895980 RepID=UPI00314528C7
MTNERREKFDGQTINQVITGYLDELKSDGIAFAGIIDEGRRGFEFSGEELIDFVRDCLTAMIEAGAKPVEGGGGTRYTWIEQPQYGSTTKEIVDNVIAEWLAKGDPDHGGLWFASPQFQHIGRPEG